MKVRDTNHVADIHDLCPRLSPRGSFGESRRTGIWALPFTASYDAATASARLYAFDVVKAFDCGGGCRSSSAMGDGVVGHQGSRRRLSGVVL